MIRTIKDIRMKNMSSGMPGQFSYTYLAWEGNDVKRLDPKKKNPKPTPDKKKIKTLDWLQIDISIEPDIFDDGTEYVPVSTDEENFDIFSDDNDGPQWPSLEDTNFEYSFEKHKAIPIYLLFQNNRNFAKR
jgi:hypothetical protein